MDRKLKLGLLLLAFAAGGFAQIPVGSPIQGPPVDLEGAGTVTDVSSGNLAPLFTVVVSNPSTAPAFAFTLSNAAGTSWFGNAAGTSGAPSYNTSAFPAALIVPPELMVTMPWEKIRKVPVALLVVTMTPLLTVIPAP